MGDNPLFSTGFPGPAPSSTEIDTLPSRIAQAAGVRDAAVKRGQALAEAALAAPLAAADATVDNILMPLNNTLSDAGTVAAQTVIQGQAATVKALQVPLAAALKFGYQSQGTPLLNPVGPTRKKRSAKSNNARGEDTGTAGKFSLNPTLGGAIPSAQTLGFSTGAESLVDPPATSPSPNSVTTTQCDGTPNTAGAMPPNPPWRGLTHDDVLKYTDAYPAVVTQFYDPGNPNTSLPIYGLMDIAGTGFPPLGCTIGAVGTLTPAQVWGAVGTGSWSGYLVNLAPVAAPPPPPPLPPSPPQCPPGYYWNGSICVQNDILGPPPPPAPPAPPPCPTTCLIKQTDIPCQLSIPWLSLAYPEFVLAERAAAKTDYDILYDAYQLGLCDTPTPQQPECSVPYLERVVPDYVLAAKAQGKTDVELLQDAINIGLCAQPTQESIQDLGTTDVENLAPGSAATLASEFDPPTAATFSVVTEATAHCPPAQFVLPDLTTTIDALIPDDIKCLVGWDRVLTGISLVVAGAIRDACNCPDGSPIDLLFQASQSLSNQFGLTGKALGAITDFLGRIVRSVTCNIGVADKYVQTLTGCGAGETAPLATIALLSGVWDRWIGSLPDWWLDALRRTTQFTCPTNPPSQPEANILLATNFISQPDWECITRANGNRIDYQSDLVRMQQHKPTDGELLTLWRKYPDNRDKIGATFEAAGWTNADWFQQYLDANDWIPTPSDAVQWMLKDVEDASIQDQFLLGAEFSQKYQGHVKEAFNWNGVSTLDAEYIWRAHWRNMAPHQLYELHKRLRPGWTSLLSDEYVSELALSICPNLTSSDTAQSLAARPLSNGFPVPFHCEEITSPQVARAWLESLATTGAHVDAALGQDDYPPFWRARLLALSYRVLTRVDARRAYEVNELTEDQLLAKFLDQGYSPPDSQALLGVYYNAAVQLHSRRPVCNRWVNTGYGTDLLKDSLISQGMRPDMWDDVFKIVNIRRQIQIQTECLKGIEKQFLIGIYTEAQANVAVLNLVNDPDRTMEIINEWKCLKLSKPKNETAAQICKEFRTGLVTGNQAKQLLRNLGYTSQQAQRILALCYLSPMPRGLRGVPIPGSKEAAAMDAALNT